MSELFGHPFCISILKVSSTEFLLHSLDFNAYYMIQEYFSKSLEILEIEEGAPNFYEKPIL